MASASTPSGQVLSSGSQGSPSPYGTPPILAKTLPHTSLSITLANHTPGSSPSSTSRASSLAAQQGSVSADSAQTLLRDVQNESSGERSSFRRSKSPRKSSSGSGSGSSHRKQYARMGLVMDSPTKNPPHPPQWPRVGSDGLEVGVVCEEEVEGGFEVVRFEQREGDVQSSPPISVRSESMGSVADQEGHASSPDSGYGNTPDNPVDHLAAGRTRSGATMDVKRVRDDTQGTPDVPVESMALAGGRNRSGAIMDTNRAREDTQDSACSMLEPSPRNMLEPSPRNMMEPSPRNMMEPSPRNMMEPSPRNSASHSNSHSSSHHSYLHHSASLPHSTGRALRGTTPTAAQLRSVGESSAGRGGRGLISPLRTPTGSMPERHQLPQDGVTPPSSLPHTTLPHSTSPTTRRRFRTSFNKHQFSKSSEMSRSKSATSLSRDEKDYFQVTDELSQENAHFSLSEALLAVIEQYKAMCDEQHQLDDFPPPPSPSPSHSSLFPSRSTPPPSYCPTSSTPPPGYSPLSQSPPIPADSAPYLTSWPSISSIATIEDSMDGRGWQGSMTRVSLLELMQSRLADHSAESTAQKLLQHMSHVMAGSIKDMSQMSIKLPTELIMSLQTDEDLKKSVITSSAHIRGSRDWAPPRKQIIYHIKQPNKNVQVELAAQGYRCTGCGMKVDSAHAKHFRFCNYVGKYFCQNCHTNAMHIIPAFILEKWSFKKLPVSNFARDLLTKFHNEPVFSVNPIQHPIYKKVGVMGQAKEVRIQLVAIRQYLGTCRRASKLKQMFDAASPWTTDHSSFSLNDLLELKAGVKLKQLRSLLLEAVTHVKSCPTCQGRGFVCEFCKNSDDIIFPFEASKVSTCRDCGCCFHKGCFTGPLQCPRCLRIKERQAQRVRRIFLEATEDEEFGEEPSLSEPSKL